MALNLSRNTKVYVSSVNGVPTTAEGGAQFLTGYIITVGSSYAAGERINFGTTSGSGANLMGIVTSIDGCLLYTSPSPRDRTRSRMPSSA